MFMMVAAAAIVVGCGGNGGTINPPQGDTRIHGSWKEHSISMNQQTLECPGMIVGQQGPVSCGNSIYQFHTNNTVTMDGQAWGTYTFDGFNLLMQPTQGTSMSGTVAFQGTDYIFTTVENGQTVRRTLRRQ
jgi:hypothetical protein